MVEWKTTELLQPMAFQFFSKKSTTELSRSTVNGQECIHFLAWKPPRVRKKNMLMVLTKIPLPFGLREEAPFKALRV